jgi:hypothetical protein
MEVRRHAGLVRAGRRVVPRTSQSGVRAEPRSTGISADPTNAEASALGPKDVAPGEVGVVSPSRRVHVRVAGASLSSRDALAHVRRPDDAEACGGGADPAGKVRGTHRRLHSLEEAFAHARRPRCALPARSLHTPDEAVAQVRRAGCAAAMNRVAAPKWALAKPPRAGVQPPTRPARRGSRRLTHQTLAPSNVRFASHGRSVSTPRSAKTTGERRGSTAAPAQSTAKALGEHYEFCPKNCWGGG